MAELLQHPPAQDQSQKAKVEQPKVQPTPAPQGQTPQPEEQKAQAKPVDIIGVFQRGMKQDQELGLQFDPFAYFNQMAMSEAKGEATITLPSYEKAKEAYAKDAKDEEFKPVYERMKSMYDGYQQTKGKFLLKPNDTPFHWTNISGHRGHIDKSSFIMDQVGQTYLPLKRLTPNPYKWDGAINTPQEEAIGIGAYVHNGRLLSMDQNVDAEDILGIELNERYFPTVDGQLWSTPKTIQYIEDENGNRIPVFRIIGEEERLTDENRPIAGNIERTASESSFTDGAGLVAGSVPKFAGLSASFLGRMIKHGSDMTKNWYGWGTGQETKKTSDVKEHLEQLAKEGKMSYDAAQLAATGMPKADLQLLANMGDIRAQQVLGVMNEFDGLEKMIYETDGFEQALDDIHRWALANSYKTSKEGADHGFTGGEKGFNVGHFLANTAEGITFLAPQIAATRAAMFAVRAGGVRAGLTGTMTNGVSYITPAGSRLARTIGASTMAAQMGGVMMDEAMELGLSSEMATLFGIASLPITFATERFVGSNWMAKLSGNTYYKDLFRKEVRDIAAATAKELGYSLETLTANEAKILGEEVAKRTTKKVFSKGSPFSLKAGREAVEAGKAQASKFFPYAINTVKSLYTGIGNRIDNMPGALQAAVTEGQQETLEAVGHDFLKKAHDQWLAKDKKFNTHKFMSAEWYNEMLENAVGGFVVGGTMGFGVKKRAEITETLYSYVAKGEIDTANKIIDEMMEAGALGFNHIDQAGNPMTEDDIKAGKKTFGQHTAELLKQDLALLDQIVKQEGLRERMDEAEIGNMLNSYFVSPFVILKEGTLALKERHEKEKKLKELMDANQDTQELHEGVLKEKQRLELEIQNAKNKYNDIINGNAARGIGLAIEAAKAGKEKNRFALHSAKRFHMMANEMYEQEMDDFRKMMSETKAKREENTAEIEKIIGIVSGIADGLTDQNSVFEAVSKLASKGAKGEFEEESVNKLKESIRETYKKISEKRSKENNTDPGMEQAMLETSGEMEKLQEAEMSAEGFSANVVKPPDVGKIVRDLFNRQMDESVDNGGLGFFKIKDILNQAQALLNSGQITASTAANMLSISSALDEKEAILNDSIKYLNKIDPEYSFKYAQTDTNKQRDASVTRIDPELEKELRKDLAALREQLDSIRKDLSKLNNIREARSNRFLFETMGFYRALFENLFSANGLAQVSPNVQKAKDEFEKAFQKANDEYASGKNDNNKVFMDLYNAYSKLGHATHEWLRSQDSPVDMIKNTINDFANNNKITQYYRYENAQEVLSYSEQANESSTRVFLDLTKNNGRVGDDPRAKAHAIKNAIDFYNTILRISPATANVHIQDNGQRVIMNFQQMLVFTQMLGFMSSNFSVIPDSSNSLPVDNAQGGERRFFSNAIAVAGDAGSGKTSIVFANIMKSMEAILGRTPNVAVLVPSVANSREIINSLKENSVGANVNVLSFNDKSSLMDKKYDFFIVDESHNFGKEQEIIDSIRAVGDRKIIFLGDNAQMPDISGQSVVNAKSHMVNPLLKLVERTQPMYEKYRAGVQAIASLQDEIRNYIVTPKAEGIHFMPRGPYKFNDQFGVQIVDVDPIDLLAQDIIAGKGESVGITATKAEKEKYVSKLISLGIQEEQARKAVKTLDRDTAQVFDPKNNKDSDSILGGKAATVFVLDNPNDISDIRLHSKYLLTAVSRAHSKVVMFGDPTISVPGEPDYLSNLFQKPNVEDVDNWLKSLYSVVPQAQTDKKQPAKSEIKPTESKPHKFEIGTSLQRADGSVIRIIGHNKDGSYEAQNWDPVKNNLFGKRFTISENSLNNLKNVTDTVKSVNKMSNLVIDEWNKNRAAYGSSMTLRDPKKVFDGDNMKYYDMMMNSKMALDLRASLGEFQKQNAKAFAEMLRDNFSGDIDSHIINQMRYFVRASIASGIGPAGSVSIVFNETKKNPYLLGFNKTPGLEIHANLDEVDGDYLVQTMNLVGINVKNEAEARRIAYELNFNHIGNLSDIYEQNRRIGKPTIPEDFAEEIKNLVNNRAPGQNTIAHGTMHIPTAKADDGTLIYDTPFIPAYNSPTNGKMPFLSYLLSIKAVGQAIVYDQVVYSKSGDKNYDKPHYEVSVVKTFNDSIKSVIPASKILVYPANILGTNESATEYLQKMISEINEDIQLLANKGGIAAMFKRPYYRLLRFNDSNIKNTMASGNTILGNIFAKYLQVTKTGEKENIMPSIIGPYSAGNKTIKELESLNLMFAEILDKIDDIKSENGRIFAHLPGENIDLTSNVKELRNNPFIKYLEVDRSYGKTNAFLIRLDENDFTQKKEQVQEKQDDNVRDQENVASPKTAQETGAETRKEETAPNQEKQAGETVSNTAEPGLAVIQDVFAKLDELYKELAGPGRQKKLVQADIDKIEMQFPGITLQYNYFESAVRAMEELNKVEIKCP